MELPLTVIIHTLNEELNLPRAIASVTGWVDQILVVDSESTDQTQTIARDSNVDLVSRPCTREGLVRQRNWALAHAVVRNGWVFILDADERVDNELKSELIELFSGDTLHEHDGWSCRFKEIFLGEWLRHSSMYPTWTVRVMRRGVVFYEDRAVNAHPIVDSERHGYLSGHLIHEAEGGFSRNLKRMESFASLEAAALDSSKASGSALEAVRQIHKGRYERRRALKEILAILPFRGTITFVYLYLFRLGFLDGRAGYHWCVYRSCLEWMIGAKRFEKRMLDQQSNS